VPPSKANEDIIAKQQEQADAAAHLRACAKTYSSTMEAAKRAREEVAALKAELKALEGPAKRMRQEYDASKVEEKRAKEVLYASAVHQDVLAEAMALRRDGRPCASPS